MTSIFFWIMIHLPVHANDITPFGQVPADSESAKTIGGTQEDEIPPEEDIEEEEEDDKGKTYDGVRRLTIWQNFLVKTAPLESRFASAIKRYFYEQRKEALSLLESLGGEELKINWDEQNEILRDRTKRFLLLGLREGIHFGRAMLSRQKSAKIKKDLEITT